MKTESTEKPQAFIQGLTFWPLPQFDGPAAAFGLMESAYFHRRNIPNVPSKFEHMAQTLMFKGGHLPPLSPLVDRSKATAVVGAWLRSYAPAHEAKIGTVAYALWLWSDVETMAALESGK